MLIAKNIRVIRILKYTWQTDLIFLITCTGLYGLDRYFLEDYFRIPASLPTIIGTALAFFIGFNNNQAYDRWWEARKIWGGLVNDSRSWARSLLSYGTTDCHPTISDIQKRMIRRHIGFIYALKTALRSEDLDEWKRFIPKEDTELISRQQNKPNALLTCQAKDLQKLEKEGFIDNIRFLALNELIVKFCDEMGKSERIKNTVFPPSYQYFTKLYIWVLVVLITMIATESIGAYSILFGTLTGFVFHTSFHVGTLLVNPFEPIITGIPLDSISRTVEINLLEMLDEPNLPKPVSAVNEEYIM